tara:strand:- start:1567 stop:1683 length:117 start_codon:yes stop_codon:yes gene_type:complete
MYDIFPFILTADLILLKKITVLLDLYLIVIKLKGFFRY